nr:Uma2 family endonuclease [Roseofilum sp. Guam]
MPHLYHQMVMGKICICLNIWSEKTGLGEAVFGPGIIFFESDYVIPDVVWISHKRLAQLLDNDGHLRGAPELVVEVLSMLEKEKKQDRQNKLKLYSVQGVREYWIVDYQQREIEIYRRNQARLEKAVTLSDQDTLTSPLLPEFQCAVESLWT